MSRGHVGNAIGVAIVLVSACAVYASLSSVAEVDLRYEAGRPYRIGDHTICWLKLENYGWRTLDNIEAEVHFPVPLVDVRPGDSLQPVKIAAGGTGKRFAELQLEQLGPGETCYLYFAAAGPEAEAMLEDVVYVQSAQHSAGVARAGRPGLSGWTPATGALLVLMVGGIGYLVVLTYRIQDVNQLVGHAREDLKMNERLVGMVTSRSPRGTQADALMDLKQDTSTALVPAGDVGEPEADTDADEDTDSETPEVAHDEPKASPVRPPHSRKSRRRSRKR